MLGVACAILGWLPSNGKSQPLLTSEQRLNVTIELDQSLRDVAVSPSGDILALWFATKLPSGGDVFARRLSPTGSPIGDEFQVLGNVHAIRAEFASDGSLLFVWAADDGHNRGIWAQRFDNGFVALGPPLLTNTTTMNEQTEPSVALYEDRYMIVWSSSLISGAEVRGRILDTDGDFLSDEFLVNLPGERAGNPETVGMIGGTFVVIWTGQDADDDGVFGRLFDVNGNPTGPPAQINDYSTGKQQQAWPVPLPGNRWIATWDSPRDGSPPDIYARVLEGTTPIGSEFRVNTYTADAQTDPVAMSDPLGNVLVVWNSTGQDGSGVGVYGQALGADGTLVGSEFRLNEHTNNHQWYPRSATVGPGEFYVAWESVGQDFGNSRGCYGRLVRMGSTLPTRPGTWGALKDAYGQGQ